MLRQPHIALYISLLVLRIYTKQNKKVRPLRPVDFYCPFVSILFDILLRKLCANVNETAINRVISVHSLHRPQFHYRYDEVRIHFSKNFSRFLSFLEISSHFLKL